jgi:hypothetical protein
MRTVLLCLLLLLMHVRQNVGEELPRPRTRDEERQQLAQALRESSSTSNRCISRAQLSIFFFRDQRRLGGGMSVGRGLEPGRV